MTKTSVGPLKRDDDSNELRTDHKEMCEILKIQYVSSYSVQREELELVMVENQIDEDLSTINDIEFTENDLKSAIKELRTNSSSGPDGITAIFFKKKTWKSPQYST